MERSFVAQVARAPAVFVAGRFQRHTSPQFRSLEGSRSGGRWGAPGAFPVIYLGRPTESVIAEAYRHLVDPTPGLSGEHVGPRAVLTCDVSIAEVLDLRSREALSLLSLHAPDLTGFNYVKCQRVGAAAHQLGLKGIIAPAATELGETLAIFERNLKEGDKLTLVATETWLHLPPDPRPRRTGDLADELAARMLTLRKPDPESGEM